MIKQQHKPRLISVSDFLDLFHDNNQKTFEIVGLRKEIERLHKRIKRIKGMPFKSKAQRKFLFKNNPKLAKEFASKTPRGKKLPARVKRKRK